MHKNHLKQEGKAFVFNHYGPAPTAVFRNPKLSLGAKSVYGYLCTFISSEQINNGLFKAWPSKRRILQDLKISATSLRGYLDELKEQGLIQEEQSHQFSEGSLYILQPYVKHQDLG